MTPEARNKQSRCQIAELRTAEVGRLPKPVMPYIDPPPWGHVAEWLRNGLQINKVVQSFPGQVLKNRRFCHPYGSTA
jgi:hypothetical protein